MKLKYEQTARHSFALEEMENEQRRLATVFFESAVELKEQNVIMTQLVATDLPTRPIPSELSITTYCHCKQCIDELTQGKVRDISAQDYARLNIGMTNEGFQIWCVRHDCNVAHIDFQGMRHPANMMS
jgi:hypothetical protein